MVKDFVKILTERNNDFTFPKSEHFMRCLTLIYCYAYILVPLNDNDIPEKKHEVVEEFKSAVAATRTFSISLMMECILLNNTGTV